MCAEVNLHTGQYALRIFKSDPTSCKDQTLNRTPMSKRIAVSPFQLNQSYDNDEALSHIFTGSSEIKDHKRRLFIYSLSKCILW